MELQQVGKTENEQKIKNDDWCKPAPRTSPSRGNSADTMDSKKMVPLSSYILFILTFPN